MIADRVTYYAVVLSCPTGIAFARADNSQRAVCPRRLYRTLRQRGNGHTGENLSAVAQIKLAPMLVPLFRTRL